MSGGPPHHPHNRQNPAANSAWNHLQVPNFFPRQPLHAHMSTDSVAAAALLHQVAPSWHVPSAADPLMKVPSSLQAAAHHHLFNLEQMVAERHQQHHVFPRDLSSPRNGSGAQQNGGDDVPVGMPPISLSVRDTNKINSMSASALEINVKSTSPSLKCLSPGLTAAMSAMQQASPKSTATAKRTATPPMTISSPQFHQQQRILPKRGVDSILERLNPPIGNSQLQQAHSLLQTHHLPDHGTPAFERPVISTVMPLPSTASGRTPTSSPIDTLQASINAVAMGVGFTGTGGGSGSQHDDNSNSSSTLLNVPTPTNAREDDVVSPYSNDDNSLDSNKSRRKRKPCKTMRVNKDVLPAATVPPPSCSPAGSDLLLKQSIDAAAIATPTESQHVITSPTPSTPSTLHQSALPTPTTATSDSPATMQMTAADPQRNTVDNNIPRPDIPLENKIAERRKSVTPPLRKTSRRKASSESETIANIAAMVQEMQPIQETPNAASIKLPTEANLLQRSDSTISTVTSSEQLSEAPFGEVENKLEEMFAGLEDASLSKPSDGASLDVIANFSKMGFDNTKDLLKLESGDALTSIPDIDTSLRRTTRSTPLDIPLDSSCDLNTSTSTPSSSRRRKKMARKSPKRSTSPSRNNAANKFASKGTKKSIIKFGSTSSSQTPSFGSKLSSDVKDIVANAYDSGSNASSSKSRGPFIQIKGPRDSPYSVCIVNSNNTADGDEHQVSGSTGGGFGGKTTGKNKFHDDSEYRQRVRVRGLHCSTLSNKYDAQTRDATWICAFCKCGPHASAAAVEIEQYKPPGDLFGPYVITTACAEYQRRLDDPYDKQFKSKKVCRSLDAVASTSKASVGRGSRSSKRKLSESQGGAMTSPTSGVSTLTDDMSFITAEQSVMLGITIMPDANTIQTPNKTISSRPSNNSITNNNAAPATPTVCYEVWAHEDCIVWSAGVHLGGGGARIVGLEAAVWASSGVTCAACGLRGANVCCMRRGCARAQHYTCARVAGWMLREDDYAAFCTEHVGLTPRGTPAAVTAPLHNGDTDRMC